MKKIIPILLTCLMILSGCTKGNESASSDYRTLYSGEIKTLNYLVTSETNEFAAVANMVDTLIDYDKYGVVKPSLATEWTVSDDGLTWTFKLREGVKWYTSTGEEYAETTAEDFVSSMKYIFDQKNQSETANIAYPVIKNGEKYYNGEITDFNQVGVKAIDKYTLQYTLEKPTSYFLSMLTYVCFFPANGKFLDETGDNFGTDASTILYNGAYTIETFQPQNKRVYVANKNYWDKDNVFIKRIIMTYNKEASNLAPEMFLRGDLDYADIPTSLLDEWMKDPSKKDSVRPSPNGFYSYFYALNFDPKFDAQYEPENWKVAVNNLNFRQAIFHALDRKAAMLTKEPYNPEEKLLNTITPQNFVALNGKDYTELGGLDVFTSTDSFNESLAKDFKEKAVKDLTGKATFPVKILLPYNTSSSDWANRAQVIEQQLEKLLGKDFIDVIIEAKPPTGFLKEVRRSGKYALLECNWGPDYADPETYTDPFTLGASYNWPELATGYIEGNKQSVYQNMVDEAKSEVLDIEKRYTLFAEAEAYFISQAFVIPYSVGGGGYVASKVNPFEAQYSPFGVASERFKGQKVLDKPMTTEEFKSAFITWEKERTKALETATKK